MKSWLANADPETAWEHLAWPEFPAAGSSQSPLVILPLHGFVDRGAAHAIDAEEVIASRILRAAVGRLKAVAPLCVLPPIRQVLAAKAGGFFGLDPETAYDQLMGICRGVRDSGCTKIVLLNSSAISASLAASVALDARAEFGLYTYLIQAADLGVDFTSGDAPLEAPTSLLVELLGEILAHRSPTSSIPASPATPNAPSEPADCFPSAYRDRYLGGFTPDKLRACAASGNALAVLPIAAIEQHGLHLPVGVDAILGQALLSGALASLPGHAPVFVAPPLIYGKSNEHAGFPGTLSIDTKTLRRTLLAAADQIARLDFRRLAIFNTHGGNNHVLEITLREIRENLGLAAFRLRAGYQPDLDPQEQAWGMHADEWETSLMLACAPEWVRMDKAVCEYPARLGDPGRLRMEKAPATFAWLTKDISTSGVLGNPTRATAENGRRWLSEASSTLGRRLEHALSGA